MQDDTKQHLLELKRLRNASQVGLFRRVELAAAVLKDKEFIADVHKGDEFAARDAITSEYFPEISGFIHVTELLQILAYVPTEREWGEYRYNLQVLRDIKDERLRVSQQSTEQSPPERRAVHRVKKADFEELQKENEHLQARIASVESVAKDSNQTAMESRMKLSEAEVIIQHLRHQVRELETENSRLRIQLKEAESQLNRPAPVAALNS